MPRALRPVFVCLAAAIPAVALRLSGAHPSAPLAIVVDDVHRADEPSLADGSGVRLISDSGEFRGFVKLAPMKPGNLEVHWPEGLPLLSPAEVDPESREPDYNALVRVEKL